jgi:lysophospholipase L1-like esterase
MALRYPYGVQPVYGFPGTDGTARATAHPALQAIAIGDSRTMGDSVHPGGWPYNANNVNQLPDGTYPPVGPYEYRQGPRSWFQHACWQSRGRLRPLFNAGQGTDDTTGMLRRFPLDVVAKAPDVVFLGDTHNDAATESVTRANITAMIDQAQAAGIGVILNSALPSDTVGKAAQMRRNNAWLKQLAQTRRLPYIDMWPAVIDLADGTYLPAMTSDGTHLSYVGAAAAGGKVIADLQGYLTGTTDWLPADNVQDVNLLTNPMFGAGASWYTSGGTATTALETDPANYRGSALAATVTAAGTRLSQDVTMAIRGIAVGDRLKWVGLARVTGSVAGLMRWALEISAPGIGSYMVRPVETTASGMDVGWFYFESEFTVPAGATLVRVGFTTSTGTGVVSLAQQGLYNLTSIATATA